MPDSRWPIRGSTTACCLLVIVAAAHAAGGRPLTTAELLVHLARDHALLQRGQQTPADVQHVRALLKAAVRIDPQQTEAHMWLYELAVLSGDDQEATAALDGLLKADPNHQAAFSLWLAAHLRSQQTTERRAAWLQSVLAEALPPAARALVLVELARLAVERLDHAEADRLLQEAFTLDPASPEAARMALQALPADAAPAARLHAMLRALAVQPYTLEIAWQIALLLDAHGLTEQAGRFFDYAISVQHAVDPRAPLPGRFLLDLARNRSDRGLHEAAVEDARAALLADPSIGAEAGIFLHYLLNKTGQLALAGEVRERLMQRFAALREPSETPLSELAQAAWFYCTLDPQPQRALMLAEAAAQRAPSDIFVSRVLGWAQALNQRPEAARCTLEPIAHRDAFAAILAAKLAHDEGDDLTAAWLLRHLDPRAIGGPARDALQASGLADMVAATSQPTSQPDSTRVALTAALDKFDDRLLDFYRHPEQFLEATVTPDDLGPLPGEPWRATFSLTNRAPFPITLGPDGMVNPTFLLSFRLDGDRKREYRALFTLSIDAVRTLYPGQTVRLRRTLDVGPLRQVSRQTPQQMQRVTIDALLDPQRDAEGNWRPSYGGQILRPVYFNRLPLMAGREAINALLEALTGPSELERVKAVEVLAELLGERQRADMGVLPYRPQPVPVEPLRDALLNMLADKSWELRVRTLDALQSVGLDRALLAAAQSNLEHPHWLVRLLALRLLARQGPAFAEQATRIAREDADELVRSLAASYLSKWQATTSAPANSGG